MKKELLIFILLMLIIQTTSAIEIKLSKESYQPMETLQAEITGNFIDTLTINNLFLYKENVPRTMPSVSGLTKYGNVYYAYMILPNQEGNFSIKIENAKYTEAGVQKTQAIVKDFTVKTTNQSVLQINPGFVRTSGDFSVKIKSLYENQDVSATFNGQTTNFSLNEDSEKTATFLIENLAGKTSLKINSYNIPVFIIEKTEINQTTGNQTNLNQTSNQTTGNQTKINVSNLTEEEVESLHCTDFGEKCDDNEECSGETQSSLEGPCCVGECIEKKERNYVWIGILIIVIVLAAIIFFYLKSRKRMKPKSTEEILESKRKRFDERMKGDSEEVSRRLGRI